MISKKKTENYEDLIPFKSVIKKIEEYRAEGFYIILFTARNMRTYDGNLGLINANTSKKKKISQTNLSQLQHPMHDNASLANTQIHNFFFFLN